jgi:hypothetical protein
MYPSGPVREPYSYLVPGPIDCSKIPAQLTEAGGGGGCYGGCLSAHLRALRYSLLCEHVSPISGNQKLQIRHFLNISLILYVDGEQTEGNN